MEPPRWTLSTGPGPLAPSVQAALAWPVVHHADPWFRAFYAGLIGKLQRALGVATPPVVLQMEAVGALEAIVAGLVRSGDHVLAVASGPYGRWLGGLAQSRAARTSWLTAAPDRAPEAGEVEAALRRLGRVDLVTLVHVETPFGTRLDLGPIAAAIRTRSDALIVVDAVAGWPGEPLELDGWGLDAVALGAHKGLGATPGVTPAWLSERAWQQIAANPAAPRASFLSLPPWRDVHRSDVPFPFTPSVVDLYALDAALDRLLAEGVEACLDRHGQTALACRAAIAERTELRFWPARAEEMASTVTVLKMPPGVDAREVRRVAREGWSVELATGVGEHEAALLRIGHMGEQARETAMSVGLDAILGALGSVGARCGGRPLP